MCTHVRVCVRARADVTSCGHQSFANMELPGGNLPCPVCRYVGRAGRRMVYNACFSRPYAQTSQRAHQSFGAMRWEMEHGEVNSAAARPKGIKASLEQIRSSMVFAPIQTCTSLHEMGHTCVCVRARVHVSIHRAVSVAPLAESYLVFAASKCCMCHREVRRFYAQSSQRSTMSFSVLWVLLRLRMCTLFHEKGEMEAHVFVQLCR